MARFIGLVTFGTGGGTLDGFFFGTIRSSMLRLPEPILLFMMGVNLFIAHPTVDDWKSS